MHTIVDSHCYSKNKQVIFSLCIIRIMSSGEVYLKRQFPVPHKRESIRSAFCPLMSFLQVCN